MDRDDSTFDYIFDVFRFFRLSGTEKEAYLPGVDKRRMYCPPIPMMYSDSYLPMKVMLDLVPLIAQKFPAALDDRERETEDLYIEMCSAIDLFLSQANTDEDFRYSFHEYEGPRCVHGIWDILARYSSLILKENKKTAGNPELGFDELIEIFGYEVLPPPASQSKSGPVQKEGPLQGPSGFRR